MSTTEDQKEKGVYELGYLILPSIPEDALPTLVTRLKEIIKKAGGAELAGEDPFKMDLAYKMSKTVGSRKYVVNDAYIGWVKFEVEPEAIPGINSEVKLVDEVLRFLLIKVPRESSFTFEAARRAIEEAESETQSAEDTTVDTTSETPVEPKEETPTTSTE